MKSLRYPIYIFVFLALVFLGDRLFAYVLSKVILRNSKFRYSRLYTGKAKCDILLIGNSRGLSYYQPFIEEVTHRKTLNLSYNSMPTNMAKVLLDDYILLYGKPKLILIDATMHGEKKQLIANLGCYAEFSPNIRHLIQETDPTIGYFNDILHLSRYNGEVFQRCLYYFNKPDSAWHNDRIITKRAIKDGISINLDTNQEENFDQTAADHYKEIVNMCRENNIEFKLIINPYLPEYRAAVKSFDASKKNLSDYINAPIYDFSIALKSHQLFSDNIHLNVKGCKEFIDLLNSNGIFDSLKEEK